jgi:hypothetical protein
MDVALMGFRFFVPSSPCANQLGLAQVNFSFFFQIFFQGTVFSLSPLSKMMMEWKT